MRPKVRQGFTLIEVMVAVLILGLAASALVQTASSALNRQQYMRGQTFALILAEQKIQDLHLEKTKDGGSWPSLGQQRSRVSSNGIDFELRTNITATENKTLRRVVVEVWQNGNDKPQTSLVGFIGQW